MLAETPIGRRKRCHDFLTTAAATFVNRSAMHLANVENSFLGFFGDEFDEPRTYAG